MKKIILNADDYGACDFINNGIIKAVKAKRINSVSSFVTHGKRTEQDIKQLVELQKDYDFEIGLHFSITSGYPESLCSTMKPAAGKPFYEIHQHNYTDINIEELRTEIRTQINSLQYWLDQAGGRKVDHITVHHGVVYFFKPLFQVYQQVAKEFNLAVRSPLPWSKSKPDYYGQPIPQNAYNTGIPIMKEGIMNGIYIFRDNLSNNEKNKLKEIITMLSAQKPDELVKQRNELLGNQIPVPFCYIDTIYGQPMVKGFEYLVSQASAKPLEFMFHLGDGDLNQAKTTAPHGVNPKYFDWRIQELNALSYFDLDTAMQQNGVELTNYSKLSLV